MKELTKKQSSLLVGGSFESRLAKQAYKCGTEGKGRACKRYARMMRRNKL